MPISKYAKILKPRELDVPSSSPGEVDVALLYSCPINEVSPKFVKFNIVTVFIKICSNLILFIAFFTIH